jgi:hypothetical protein
MLTEIFYERYRDRLIWDSVEPAERGLLVQCFRLMSEQLFPSDEEQFWSDLHNRISMELGLESLSPEVPKYVRNRPVSNFKAMTRQYMLREFDVRWDADVFMKARISIVELAFRKRGEEVAFENRQFAAHNNQVATIRATITGHDVGAALTLHGHDKRAALNAHVNTAFNGTVGELNERLRRAGVPLHYHSGFFQISSDELTTNEIEEPFWQAIATPLWASVDTDMKQAIDDRDSGGRDPAWHAAKALESTIKIISDQKGWTHGGEKGAQNYVENLASKKAALIETWEADILKRFFSGPRKDFAHGVGSAPIPKLSPAQTQWAIEFAMSWIKALVRRSGL